ncbi:indolepyruvate ferredoxin oxidoreductase family protein [Orrella sp. JC864]|uniref:indolepyruvate ferredoxin oxidoreductase family protein n=1 Tax=Orrella sp. JC864 TaxID=3120298 RepID=UPI003008179E
MANDTVLDQDYELDDNLARTEGRIFLTGTQALVRMLLAQRRLDAAQGLNTAGFVSGYRGSPLGGVDMAMWRARQTLQAHQIRFVPAINEDLAATMLMGTQQAGMRTDRKVDGVFGLWYGKGPGLDRAGDALHHGHAAGASQHGGVLVVVGDDHTAVSSSIPHASEPSLMGWGMPIVHPASVADYEAFGLWGWALSRHAGTWVAFKAVSETVESGRSMPAAPPVPYSLPGGGALPYSTREFLGPAIETRMAQRLEAVAGFAAAHSLDKLLWPAPHARVGVIAVGKAALDTLQALRLLGVDGQDARAPVRLYQPGLVYPLERQGLRRFAQGLAHILVVEEKGGVVEGQVKDLLFNDAARPSVAGKAALSGEPLIPAAGQLRPSLLAGPLGRWLQETAGLRTPWQSPEFAPPAFLSNEADGLKRTPYFCSGCPHSTSTRVPEGSQALGGVGCHYMATWMDRSTQGLTQMGGEGADWVGAAPYVHMPHVFQNMGEGTYYHSGYLAIRQAVAARAHITYKILFNDAVAMTGGQPVDGPISVPRIVRQLLAEGVARVAVTTDEPARYAQVRLPEGVQVFERHALDTVQRELREIPGVTVLIHDQTCAAEKRRRRKKKTATAKADKAVADPARRLFINTAVCEGCGDCGGKSNCLSVVPVQTPYGLKRAIDQSSCNKDFSCADGFCPSFVSVLGGTLRSQAAAGPDLQALQARLQALPLPPPARLERPFSLLVAGVGGTGVITVGALVSMAAHLEGHEVSVLDLTGLAQKGGTVLSHLRLAPAGQGAAPVRLDWRQADTAIVCDLVAGVSPDALGTLRAGATQVVANTYIAPLPDFIRRPEALARPQALLQKIRHAAGQGQPATLDAHALAEGLFGDAILANIVMLGYAWQRGWVPVSHAALMRALALNGVAVAANRAAFDAGRLAAHEPQALAALLRAPAQVVALRRPETLAALVHERSQDLAAYQDAAYARRYRERVAAVERAEAALREAGQAPRLAMTVARQLYRLMAYKDEYEVARLYTDGRFAQSLQERFAGDFKLNFHMAPPLLARKDPRTGEPRKITLGPRTWHGLRLLARLKRLRGTWLDPFGHTAERRQERALLAEYEAAIERLLRDLRPGTLEQAERIAALPEQVRGYGHVKARSIAAYRQALAGALQDYGRGTAEPDLRRSA